MLELPEAINIAKQLNHEVSDKKVIRVLPPTKLHKFCWFNGEPALYNDRLTDSRIITAEGFGIFAQLQFDNGEALCINDGVNVRLTQTDRIPADYQLAVCLEGNISLVFTVAMYGGIVLHKNDYDNEYYLKSKQAVSPFSAEFPDCYRHIISLGKPNLSAKALLATGQRFPGIGNGTAQDILFNAHIHPRKKLVTFSDADLNSLLLSIRSTLSEMIEKGGRDTEKDLYGNAGGYKTKMSKISLAEGCPVCGGEITKETYLGGSVYYCNCCQPL